MPNVFATNTTSSSITVAGHKVYYIDSTDAEIVEVQDGNNVKYNAFKYTLSGTPYWYVIDGEHDTWTDDLSEWGYSEVPVGPVLPEVGSPYWLAPDTGNGTSTVQPNALQSCVESLSTHEKVAFNSSMSYGVNFWKNPDNTLGGHSEFSIANVNGYVGIKNVSNRAIAVYWVNYAICSDSTATVVTVYNSSNVAYNAFKFTANNTDYYYVLDGTQTGWTDDLAGIGYYLSIVTAYVTDDRSSAWVDQNGKSLLFNSSGDILYGNGRGYYLLSVLLTSGTSTTDGFSIVEPTALFLANAGSTRKVSSVTIAFI